MRKALISPLPAVAWILFLLLACAPASVRAAEDERSAAAANAAANAAARRAPQPSAVEGAPMLIAVVDLDRVTRESLFSRQRAERIQEDLARATREFESLRGQLERLQSEYERQRALMAEEKRQERENEIRDLIARIEDLDARARREFERARDESKREFLRRLREAAQELGQNGGYDLIVSADMVLFASPRADITDLVIAQVDEAADPVAPDPSSPSAPGAKSAPPGSSSGRTLEPPPSNPASAPVRR